MMMEEHETVHKRFDIEDGDCISCGLCHERAPENFETLDGADFASVRRQPQDADESTACEDAADYCPTGAITHVDAVEVESDDFTEPGVLLGGAQDSAPSPL